MPSYVWAAIVTAVGVVLSVSTNEATKLTGAAIALLGIVGGVVAHRRELNEAKKQALLDRAQAKQDTAELKQTVADLNQTLRDLFEAQSKQFLKSAETTSLEVTDALRNPTPAGVDPELFKRALGLVGSITGFIEQQVSSRVYPDDFAPIPGRGGIYQDPYEVQLCQEYWQRFAEPVAKLRNDAARAGLSNNDLDKYYGHMPESNVAIWRIINGLKELGATASGKANVEVRLVKKPKPESEAGPPEPSA